MVSDDVYVVGGEGWSYGWWVMMVCAVRMRSEGENNKQNERRTMTQLYPNPKRHSFAYIYLPGGSGYPRFSKTYPDPPIKNRFNPLIKLVHPLIHLNPPNYFSSSGFLRFGSGYRSLSSPNGCWVYFSRSQTTSIMCVLN